MEQKQGIHCTPEDFERGKPQANGLSANVNPGVPQSLSMTSISSKPEYRKQISRVNLIDDPPSRSLVVKIRRSLNCSMAVRLVVVLGILAVALLILVGLYVAATTRPAKSSESTRQPLIPSGTPCLEKAIPRALPSIPAALRGKLSMLRGTTAKAFIVSKAKAASLNVYYRGERWESVNLGHMDYTNDSSEAPTDNTIWPVASITKVFTVLMLQKLHDEGKISTLDDPVVKYNKDFRIRSLTENITLRQLCCMMSGLPREAPCNPPTEFNYCPYTSEEMKRNISRLFVPLRPDITPSYSNLGFGILGDVLTEVVKPKSYFEWMKESILGPLGMHNSGYQPRSRAAEIPLTCSSQGKPLSVMNWGWLDSAAGMYSTVSDLAKISVNSALLSVVHGFVNEFTLTWQTNQLTLGSALLEMSPALVFKNTTVRRALKPVFEYPDHQFSQGCPFEIFRNEPYEVYTKSGAALGYSSMIAIIPDLKLNVNIMVANGGNENAVQTLLRPYIFNFANDLATYLRNTSQEYYLPRNSEAMVGSYKLVTDWQSVTRPVNVSIYEGKLLVVVEWFRAYLKEEGDEWILSSKYKHSLWQNYCHYSAEANGLYFMIYKFDKPQAANSKSPGFTVEGITAFGYARFERID